MSFQKNKYTVLKGVISPELAKFVTEYFLLKRKVARTLFDERYISQFTTEFGVWNDEQVPKYLFTLCGHSNGNLTRMG